VKCLGSLLNELPPDAGDVLTAAGPDHVALALQTIIEASVNTPDSGIMAHSAVLGTKWMHFLSGIFISKIIHSVSYQKVAGAVGWRHSRSERGGGGVRIGFAQRN